MPNIEIYQKDQRRDDVELLFEGDFPFLPRVGETISRIVDTGSVVELLTPDARHLKLVVNQTSHACVDR
jgi:hypothetical protein